jgi:hypothetical protein
MIFEMNDVTAFQSDLIRVHDKTRDWCDDDDRVRHSTFVFD